MYIYLWDPYECGDFLSLVCDPEVPTISVNPNQVLGWAYLHDPVFKINTSRENIHWIILQYTYIRPGYIPWLMFNLLEQVGRIENRGNWTYGEILDSPCLSTVLYVLLPFPSNPPSNPSHRRGRADSV